MRARVLSGDTIELVQPRDKVVRGLR
jgi:hypothetical protein